MLLEFSKRKDGEKICCLGTWKRCTFAPRVWKAGNVFNGETQRVHFFSAPQGTTSVLGDFPSVRLLPAVPLVLPHVRVAPALIYLQVMTSVQGLEKSNACYHFAQNCSWVVSGLGFTRARIKPNDYGSENYCNLLIIVFARILPQTTWIKKSPFFSLGRHTP